MRPHTPLGRLGLATAAASVAVLAFAAPARAEEPVDTSWVVPTMEFVVNVPTDGTTAKPVKIAIDNSSPNTAINTTTKIDFSNVPGSFVIDPPGAAQGCTISGSVATCVLAELAPNATHVYTMGVRRGDPNVLEGQGEIRVTTGADNMAGEVFANSLVQLAGPGPDMVIQQIDDVTLKPGESMDVPVRAANEGTQPAEGMLVVISTGLNLELPNPYSNCAYDPEQLTLACFFDLTVQPGEEFFIDPETPLKLKASDTAPGPQAYSAYAAVMPLSGEEVEARAAKAGSGKQLRMVKAKSGGLRAAAEVNDYDNWTDFLVNVPLHEADSVAVGATVGGAVGDKKTVKVGVRNDGPADQLSPDEGWSPFAAIVLPEGLKVLAVDQQCVPVVDGDPQWNDQGKANGLAYLCWPSGHVEAGGTYLFPFQVEIVDAPGAPGSIVVDGGVQDTNTANNTAAITLTAGGGGGGDLPTTGARAGLVAGAGALLVAAGAVAIVLFRRRRIVTVAD